MMAWLFWMSTQTLAFPSGVAAIGVRCSNDEDCSWNVLCVNKSCVCDPGWTTLPFGPNNTLSPGCGYLDFLPSPISACGHACAFHGGDGGVDRKTTPWGDSVVLIFLLKRSKFDGFPPETIKMSKLDDFPPETVKI